MTSISFDIIYICFTPYSAIFSRQFIFFVMINITSDRKFGNNIS